MTYDEWQQQEVDLDYVIENFIEEMKPYVDDMECFYSDDGASFTGYVNILAVLDLIDTNNDHILYRELMRINELWKTAWVTRKSSRYCHKKIMEIENYDIDTCNFVVPSGLFMGLDIDLVAKEQGFKLTSDFINSLAEPACEEVLDWLKEKARELYRNLEKEYEYQTSREAYEEWARDNLLGPVDGEGDSCTVCGLSSNTSA
jgi:hypothetical protein